MALFRARYWLLYCLLAMPVGTLWAQSAANAAASAATGAPPLTLATIMAEPDWIGNAVEQAWWSVDGDRILYRQKQNGSPVREIYAADPSARQIRLLGIQEQVEVNSEQGVYDRARRFAVYLRHGDIWWRSLESGAERRLTSSAEIESDLQWSADAGLVSYRRGDAWFVYDLEAGVERLAADLRMEDDPEAEPEQDFLTRRQMALFKSLRRDEQDRKQQQEREQQLHAADHLAAPEPWYLGKQYRLVDSSLAPDGHFLLVVTSEAAAEPGRPGKMPKFVTQSGYVDIEDVRTRVGGQPPAGEQLWLLDLEQREQHLLDWSVLPGIDQDPLAALRREQELPPLEGLREVRVTGIEWHSSGHFVAVQLRAIDNKDRWLATIDLDTYNLVPRHRLTDPAWINWNFNEFGWLPGAEHMQQPVLWFLSEETGYAHLYTLGLEQSEPLQLTSGDWEVSEPRPAPDGEVFYFLANRRRPVEYELYRLEPGSGDMMPLTNLDGVTGYRLSPDRTRMLVAYSGTYLPQQLAVIGLEDRNAARLTDTRTGAYRAIDWLEPEIVQVPSKHGAGQPIWSKLYLPDFAEHTGLRPVVLFVHGAGYTQNTHLRYPYYFREQMFHNLLAKRGFIVLDMDYRASAGYGRDWRTAIYRNMGHPELEDLLDGIDWLVENHPVDRDQVGIYGGSYGGFMTLMAMFRTPRQFVAGAALRPVTDWASYNHFYTANILNTPKLDPEAYRRSSPIDHAEGLENPLLIAHGMLDDNVLYQDSVRLAQRLIELRKSGWELAGYPMEAHSFERADSWYDEYRRVLELFERELAAAD